MSKLREAEYQAKIDEAREACEGYRKEALAHLDAIPELDAADALESTEVVILAAKSIAFYVNHIHVLTVLMGHARNREANAAPTRTPKVSPKRRTDAAPH